MHNAHSQQTQLPFVVGILLAAGFSRRFGQADKLMQPLHDGMPVAMASAWHLLQALPRVVAVIRPENTVLNTALLSLGVHVAVCDTETPEMADSLKLAIQTAHAQFPALSGYVLALADMPFIAPATIAAVAGQLLAGAQIVQPVFAGQRGHPVGFSSTYRSELLAVSGDQGARDVLRAHQDAVLLLPCEDAGSLQDIDTPADLR
jgi:molybdenum cofactor cytidylyltransferase